MTTTAAKPKSLMRSTSLVALMTSLSRVLGFVRDMAIAHLFGAQAGVDAFFVAFKIPNFMRRLFAEGAFTQAFVPILSEYQETRTHEQVKQLVARIAGTLGLVLLLVTFFAVIFSPVFIMVFAPGFVDEPIRYAMAVDMLRVTFPYLLFISLTAMAGAVLNTYDRFGIPAFTPVLLNISMILCAYYLAPHLATPVKALAWGVLVAGIVQLCFQLPFLWRINLLSLPKLIWHDEGVRRVIRLMVPALFGVSVAQVNLLLDTVFASFLQVGSVSWLYYSDRLTNFPLGVFGVAISTVIMPHLSRKHAAQSTEAFSETLDWAMRMILLVAIPACVGLALLAGPLLTTLFQYGKFHPHDVVMARLSLIAFALGLPAFMLIKVFASGFYARQDIKTPVWIGAYSMLANVVLNLILIYPLAHAGLALATSLSAYLNAGMLFILLKRREIYVPVAGWNRFRLQLALATLFMVGFISYFYGHLDQWLAWQWAQRCAHLGFILTGAISIYLASLWLSGVRLKHLRH